MSVVIFQEQFSNSILYICVCETKTDAVIVSSITLNVASGRSRLHRRLLRSYRRRSEPANNEIII